MAMGWHSDGTARRWDGMVLGRHGIAIVEARTVAGHSLVLVVPRTPIYQVKGGEGGLSAI